MDCGKHQHRREVFTHYFSTKDLPSVQRAIGIQVDEQLEYDTDENDTARISEIESQFKLQIWIFVSYPWNFEEVNRSDPKIECVQYWCW